MSLPKFSYCSPKTLKEASILLAEHEDKARLIAGGTDLLIRMRHRVIQPEFIIGLSKIPDIDYIHTNHNKEVRIGTMATLSAVALHPVVQQHFPALAYSAGVTATVQIRNMGTVVGNICNASPSADTATPLLVYDTRVVIVHPGGERSIPLTEFFRGPGKTALEEGELVKELILIVPQLQSGSNYQKISARSKVDIAAVGVSASVTLNESNQIHCVRIALGAVAPVPKRVPHAEKLLEGNIATPELINEAAQAAQEDAAPISDMRASGEYRRNLVAVLTRRALQKSIDMALSKKSRV